MFRLDRSRTAGPMLEWKVRIFVVAAGLGLAGMYLEEAWLTGAAIALLLGGVLLRYSPGGDPTAGKEDEKDEKDADEGIGRDGIQDPGRVDARGSDAGSPFP